MYRVIIAEDEKFVRVGLRSMIHWDSLDMEVVGDAKNGEEAYEFYLRYKPHVILTDLRMPIMDGLDLIRKIRASDKKTKFIIITCLEEFSLVQQALELGVSSYILKHTSGIEEIEEKLESIRMELDSAKERGVPLKKENEQYLHPKLNAAINYISKNFDKDITLQSTSEHIGVTPNYLGRLFVAESHQTFTEMLNEIRIKKALELLGDLTLSVSSIAALVGFSNSTYFIRVFKRAVGCTPGEYRMRRTNNNE